MNEGLPYVEKPFPSFDGIEKSIYSLLISMFRDGKTRVSAVDLSDRLPYRTNTIDGVLSKFEDQCVIECTGVIIDGYPVYIECESVKAINDLDKIYLE